MKKNLKRKKKARLEDIIPDPEYRASILEGLHRGEALLGPEGVFKELLQSILNAALEGEMDHHLSEERNVGKRNRRNGHGKKVVRTEAGSIELTPPRDREATFDPVIVEKRSRELNSGFDDIILSMYGKGNSVSDIKHLLYNIYGVECSESMISDITDRIWPEIIEWQQRPLNSCYTLVYLDGIHFRVREDSTFVNKCVYSAYAVDVEGNRDVLGIYISGSESSNEWGMVLEDLKRRGVEDILIVSVDGLSGFKETIEAVYPETIVQRCIVHKIRNSIRFVSHRERRPICTDLRKIYTAANHDQALGALEAFKVKWGRQGERIGALWEKDWEELMNFMNFGQHLRRMMYTTNPVEALHRVIRKATKSKGAWINEKALTKQLYLVIMENEKSWKRKAFNFRTIQRELAEKFGDRYTKWLG